MYHFGFIIEQALGHITHGQNLQMAVPQDPQVRADWGLIPFDSDGWAGRVPIYNSNWTVRSGLRARKLLAKMQRQEKLDAILFHTQVPAILAQDWLTRVPGIVSLDATPRQYDRLGAFYSHSTGPAWLEHWKLKLMQDCFDKARHLVTWSEWARQSLINEYDIAPDKVTVIPPGVNTQIWKRTQAPTIGPGPVRVLFVGGNLERKGGLLLLEAFRQLRREGLAVELHLVTRDTLPQEEGLTIYQDLQPNSPALINLYHGSDIFCLPTYGDCLPMVLSEAAAGGIPLISTNVAGIPEVVLDGETGLLVSPGDQAGLTRALRQMVSDSELRARMGAAAEDLVHQKLDAQANAMRLLEMMKQIAGSQAPDCASEPTGSLAPDCANEPTGEAKARQGVSVPARANRPVKEAETASTREVEKV